MSKRAASSARGERVARKRQRTVTARKIDYSDIPEASDEQLRTLRRVGRPPLGSRARQLIAIRLDPGVLRKLRKEALRRNLGYQTLVNRILANYVRRHVA